jgi:hypothetical protein
LRALGVERAVCANLECTDEQIFAEVSVDIQVFITAQTSDRLEASTSVVGAVLDPTFSSGCCQVCEASFTQHDLPVVNARGAALLVGVGQAFPAAVEQQAQRFGVLAGEAL